MAKSYTDVSSGTARCSEPTQPQIPNFIVSSQHTAWVLRTPVNGNNNFTLYILHSFCHTFRRIWIFWGYVLFHTKVLWIHGVEIL